MATIDPMASLKATAEQRTEDFEGLPLEPETPNRKATKFSRSHRTFYIHPNAGIRIARVLWDDPDDGSPLYDDSSAQHIRKAKLSSENPHAAVTVYVANLKTGDGKPLYWGEVTGSVTDTFLGIVTDPDVLLRRAAELDLEHIS